MADNTNRIAGVAYLTAGGKAMRLAADAAYQVSGVTRTGLVGQDGPHGYSETPVNGHIKATLRDANDVSLADINAMSNETIVLELANGKTVIARNAFTTEAQEVKTTDATFEVTWESPDVSEN